MLVEISPEAFETSRTEITIAPMVSCSCAMAALKSSCTFLYSSANSVGDPVGERALGELFEPFAERVDDMLDLRRRRGPRRFVALALYFRRLLRIGGCGFQAGLLDRGIAEHQHRPGHVSELVAAVGARHLDIVLAFGQRRHRVDQLRRPAA